jgi:hypothetical protein
MIVSADTDDVLDLQGFIDYLEDHLDPDDEASIVAAAPRLRALANNRRFLSAYLRAGLTSGFPLRHKRGSPTFMVHRDRARGYAIRVVGWPPADQLTHFPGGASTHGYAEVLGALAHNHDFHLLTVGYAGPGYETDMYGVPTTLPEVGAAVPLAPLGRFQLSPGTVLFYPASRVAHLQHVPSRFSISVNLIVRGPDRFAEQYLFDLATSTVAGVTGSANDTRSFRLAIAQALASPVYVPALERICQHPAPRVRREAALALERCSATSSRTAGAMNPR